MKARVAASVVLAVGVVIGTAGCDLIAPQETTHILQATSFGVEGNVGKIHIRNAYFVAKGQQMTLVATFVNTGDASQTLLIQPNASVNDTKSVKVGLQDPTIIGPNDTLQWDDFKAKPGSLLPVFFTYGTATGVTLQLPVLTGDFSINSTLTPTPVSTGTPTPGVGTPTPGATSTKTPVPTPTATPAG